MNRHTEERNGRGSSSSNDNRKRRWNEDVPSGGMVDQNGAGGSKHRHYDHGGRGRGRGTRNHDNGGTGGRCNRRGRGGGGGRDGNQSKRVGSSGRHNQNRRHNNGGRGRANGHHDRDHGNKRPNSSASATSTLKSNSNYSFNGEDASTATTTTTTTHVVSRSSSMLSSQGDDIITLPSLATATANASLFTTISNSSPNSNNTQPAIRDNKTTTTTTLLSWPNPHSHYIPITQEEHLLPALIHWGQSERGMMKDQPPFRLQTLQNVLDHNHRNNTNASTTAGNNGNHNNNNNGNKKNNNSNQSHTSSSSSSSTTTTQSISLLQSLSLRRHHLKLLNPKYPMSALRLGNEQDIRNAAQLFELAVDAYLKRHPNVQYVTEEEQRAQYEEKVRGIMPTRKDRKEMKQPPTPDFVMRDGHCVRLSFFTAGDVDDCDANAKCNKEGVHGSNDHALTQQQHEQHQQQHPTSINWIEAKMFYGASTIPPNTPNAVGCILPKMKTYVSLYGTGAIVFMYGCGSQLARDLLDVGVIALDARHLDLSAVEKQQRGWCADGWGSILF